MGEFQDFRRIIENTNTIQKMIRGTKNRLTTFKANASNSGIIYITSTQESLKGYPLNGGEGLGDIVLENNQDIFMWGDTAEDRLEGIVYDNPYLKKECD